MYARMKKQLKEVGNLQNFKKGRIGAKRKVTGDLYEKLKEIIRKNRGIRPTASSQSSSIVTPG